MWPNPQETYCYWKFCTLVCYIAGSLTQMMQGHFKQLIFCSLIILLESIELAFRPLIESTRNGCFPRKIKYYKVHCILLFSRFPCIFHLEEEEVTFSKKIAAIRDR